MKWYTREWASGALSDREEEAVLERHRAHWTAFLSEVVGPIREFAEQANPELVLDDARFQRMEIDRPQRRVVLVLVQGDLQVGYGELTLSLSSATVEEPALEELRTILEEPRSEVWYVEVDRSDDSSGPYELRLLIWPAGLLRVRFAQLGWTRVPVPDRTVLPGTARLVVR